MPGLIGKKIGMTSVFGADGKNIPCTVIEAGPCVVTQVRTVETDGYSAIQLAYDENTEKHASAPLMGHFKKAGTTPKRKLVEFPADYRRELKLGVLKLKACQEILVKLFRQERSVQLANQAALESGQ